MEVFVHLDSKNKVQNKLNKIIVSQLFRHINNIHVFNQSHTRYNKLELGNSLIVQQGIIVTRSLFIQQY